LSKRAVGLVSHSFTRGFSKGLEEGGEKYSEEGVSGGLRGSRCLGGVGKGSKAGRDRVAGVLCGEKPKRSPVSTDTV